MKKFIATLLMVASVGAFAQTYNARTDYKKISPVNVVVNEVWSYGFIAVNSGVHTFKLFDSGRFSSWQTLFASSSTEAHVWRNDGTTTVTGVKPGQFSLHPGSVYGEPMNSAAAVRFTAPEAGTYSVWAKFYKGDCGNMSAWVVLNSGFKVPLVDFPETDSEPVFSSDIDLSLGGKLIFMVGNDGSYVCGNTPVNIIITKK